MQGKAKRIVAALVGVAMTIAPVSAWADPSADGQDYCATYAQVASHATGGDYVGGILSYEGMGNVSRSEPSTTSTVTTTVTIGAPGNGTSTTITTTTTQPGNVTTTQEPIGTYNMNDGTVWEVNCLTGAAHKVG